jgi:hypothetical protein
MTTERPTAREKFRRELATNPQFKEAPRTGQGFVILGARATAGPNVAAKFGAFESNPTRFTNDEAWVLFDKVWKKFPIAEINMGAAVLSEAKYVEAFGQLPPLPSAAFASGE